MKDQGPNSPLLTSDVVRYNAASVATSLSMSFIDVLHKNKSVFLKISWVSAVHCAAPEFIVACIG